ncbi:unnamed protein product [Rotaria magnacalcarata]
MHKQITERSSGRIHYQSYFGLSIITYKECAVLAFVFQFNFASFYIRAIGTLLKKLVVYDIILTPRYNSNTHSQTIIKIIGYVNMATIFSFPIRQQQQLSSTMRIGADALYAHFWLRPSINRIFHWSNKLRKMYSFILFVCITSVFWLPIMNADPRDITEFILAGNNNSLTESQLRNWAFAKRCTFSSSVSVYNMKSYGYMQFVVLLLCVCSNVFLLGSQWLYEAIYHDQLIKSRQWCSWCRNILICLVSASICNQLASVLGCRPIEILYDIRPMLMFIVQIISFSVCLLFAFFLGVKYSLVTRKN